MGSRHDGHRIPSFNRRDFGKVVNLGLLDWRIANISGRGEDSLVGVGIRRWIDIKLRKTIRFMVSN